MAANTEELGLEVFVEGWQKFERIMDKLDKSIDDTAKGMEKTGSIAGGAFAVALGVIAVNAAMALGRALWDAGKSVIAFGADSLQMAADFQSQMAVLEIAAGSTGLSFDQLHDAALQVGGDTTLMGVSATGAADAMTGLFKAGLSNVEVFGDLDRYMQGTASLGGALRASIDLAAASELDMVQASDLAAVALASFGSELETETERADFINAAMDNMVQAADASVAEVSDLAQALTMVGPSAGAAGISIQDTNNALALLSTRGISGSRAGTSLDAMFRSLTDTTPMAQDALDAYGISIFDTEGEMKPLVDIIGQFEGALGTATDAERAAALGAIFTAQGQRAMNTLLSEGVEGWDSMADATANAAGIQEQAAARSQTYNAQMEALEGTIETLKIGIGEQFLPVAQELAVWAGDMVMQHGPRLQEIFGVIAEGIAVAAEILMGFIDGSLGFADFIPIGSEVQGVFDTMGAWWAEFGPAIQEAGATLFATLIEQGTELKENVMPFINELLETFSMWWMENGPLIVSYIEQTSEVWGFLVTAVSDFWAVVEPILTGLFEIILELATFILALATGDWATAWEAIQEVVSIAWEAIQESWAAFVEYVLGFLGTTWAQVTETWASNWEMFKIIVAEAWEIIKAKATEIWDSIVAFIDEKLQALLTFLGINTDEMKERWQTILEDIAVIAEEIWSRIVTFVTEQAENIKVAVEEKVNELKAFWGPIWEEISATVSETWTAIVEAVTEKAQEVYGVVTEKIEEIKSWIQGKVADFVTIGSALIEGFINGIKAKAQALVSAATEVVQGAVNAAKSALGVESPSTVFFDIGDNLAQGLIDGIRSKAEEVADTIGGLFGVGTALGSFGGAVASRLKKEWAALDSQLSEMKEGGSTLDSRISELKDEQREIEKERLALLEPGAGIGVPWQEAESKRWALILREREIKAQIAKAEGEQVKNAAEIAKAEEEQIRRQKQLLALEKQRSDLAFLKQQADLLDLIREHGLDAADILGGLELGIDASLEGIVQAMTAAMEAIVTQVEQELEISSPSKVFARIGARMMQGLSQGVASFAPTVNAQIRGVVGAPARAMAGGGGDVSSAITNNFNLTTNATTRAGGLALEFETMSFASR